MSFYTPSWRAREKLIPFTAFLRYVISSRSTYSHPHFSLKQPLNRSTCPAGDTVQLYCTNKKPSRQTNLARNLTIYLNTALSVKPQPYPSVRHTCVPSTTLYAFLTRPKRAVYTDHCKLSVGTQRNYEMFLLTASL
jgi:hypothetical protein